jgi:hypothetical protein
MTKICIKCGIEKELILFVKTKNSCKECESLYKKEYALRNKEKLKEKSKEYYSKNKDSIKEREKERYNLDRERKLTYQKEYSEENREKIKKYKSEYSRINREKIRSYKTNYQRERRKNDPIFKLKSVISRIIRNSIKCKGLSKNKKSIDILGCDIEFFKNYLEERFVGDMSWDNYGVIWDIDHIIPLSSAINEDDVIKLNHYTNLQPLDSYTNRFIKRDKIDFDLNK